MAVEIERKYLIDLEKLGTLKNANRIKQLNIQPSLPMIMISYPNNSYYTSLKQLRFTFYYKN